MGDLRAIAMAMLWLVALFLLLDNASGATRILTGAGETWFAGIKVLQGR